MKNNYEATMRSCFVGYTVLAIVNNFVPLLFAAFQTGYGISLNRITLLISVNFAVQIATDALATVYVDRIGYRASAVAAHVFSALGLVGLAVLPSLLPPFAGLLAAVALYAVGGGLIEVLISPIMESCPTENKERAMSLLHSFYCWGHVAVVLLSTAFFALFGVENWRLMALLWALIPALNAFAFARVPIAPLISPGEKGMTLRQLFSSRLFWLLLLIMVCAGASEHAVAQWSSLFAEKGLGISKTLGDLAGPMMFAVMMGSARVLYGKFGEKICLDRFVRLSAALCVAGLALIALVRLPWVNLVGCGICGFAVGILWPGTFSKAAAAIRNGGTAMFAVMALAGDLGCSLGPAVVGTVSALCGGDLQKGFLCAAVFPAVLILSWRAVCRLSGRKTA